MNLESAPSAAELPGHPVETPKDSSWRILTLAIGIYALDQVTKWAVLRHLEMHETKVVIPGFFNFVHWGNTGAAWSLFSNNNRALAAVSGLAMVLLWVFRFRFEAHRPMGQASLGLLFGGIVGNLTDRLMPSRQHVVDFLYFHIHPRGGGEHGFPAFNVADTAICTGVGLMMLLSYLDSRKEVQTPQPPAPRPAE